MVWYGMVSYQYTMLIFSIHVNTQYRIESNRLCLASPMSTSSMLGHNFIGSLPKISVFLDKCLQTHPRARLARRDFIQTSHLLHLWVLGSLINVDIHSYESTYC